MAGTLVRGSLTYLPVVPGRIEFAARVRRLLLALRPKVVAVELPSSLDRVYQKAIARMPKLSVIVISDPSYEEKDTTYIPVEPGDPFVEAIRTGIEIGAEIVFLEPATQTRPHVDDHYAEPWAVEVIGTEATLPNTAFIRRSELRLSLPMRPPWPGSYKAPTRSPPPASSSLSTCSIRCWTLWRRRRRNRPRQSPPVQPGRAVQPASGLPGGSNKRAAVLSGTI